MCNVPKWAFHCKGEIRRPAQPFGARPPCAATILQSTLEGLNFLMRSESAQTLIFAHIHITSMKQSTAVLRDLEIIKIRELRRIFGCSFRCNAGRIVCYVTGITTETTAKKTSKACILIFSKSLSLGNSNIFNSGPASK